MLYGDRNNWFAAYTYWYLKYYGHEDVRLVNGPREKWIAEGRPTTAELPSHPPAAFRALAGDDSIRARRDEVLGALGGPTRLVDVRSPQEYSGELMAMPGYEHEGAQRAGHIPGAASIPWARAVRDDGTFRSADELAALYARRRRRRAGHRLLPHRRALGAHVVRAARVARRARRQELRRLLDRVGQPRRRARRAGRGMTVRLLALTRASCSPSAPPRWRRASRDHGGHEVWAVDQSNTNGTQSGGTLYVYDGRRLRRPRAHRPGGADARTCAWQRTGSAPVRPHMLLFSPRHSHAVLSFVASGHVVFFDARSRAPVACIDVGAQAHAAVPSPDGSYVIVADQNGKQRAPDRHRLPRRARSRSSRRRRSTSPTGTTPSGAPRQDPLLRPDTAPICPIVDSSSRLTFVTLRGGGLFVLDSRATPLRIVAEYDRETIHGNGCGGVETRGKLYLDSGGGTAANMDEFDVYAFDLARLPQRVRPPGLHRAGAEHPGAEAGRQPGRPRCTPTRTASRWSRTTATCGSPTAPATASS